MSAMGRNRRGPSRPIALAEASTTSSEMPAAAAMTFGRSRAGKFVRKRASRAVFAPICCSRMKPAATVA
jgi:hypothetical protein